jgi:choline dehydrogenase-like flavoprotein
MPAASYDTIVIGSGFGGSMVAHMLVEAGQRVLMIERGSWVQRGEQAALPEGSHDLTPHYCKESPIRVIEGEGACGSHGLESVSPRHCEDFAPCAQKWLDA